MSFQKTSLSLATFVRDGVSDSDMDGERIRS